MYIYLWYLLGWVDVTWDRGKTNSYRMGAESKYDLSLAVSHDPSKLRQYSASKDAKAKNSDIKTKVSSDNLFNMDNTK